MKSYPAIEDHGLIGDLQTAALVTCDGTIDWFCAPRFDSPSVFCALLDKDKGGFFQIAPHDVRYVTKQLYLPGTPILITRFISADGVAEVMDFMPVTGERVTDSHRIVRMVNMVRGSMRFRVECRPRFDFARESHELERHRNGYLFRSRSATLAFNPIDPVRQLWAKTGEIRMEDGDLIAYGTLQEGDTGGVVLETGIEEPRIIPPEEVQGMFEWTRDYWRRWVERSRYTGRWREMVERSAITLKLMTYAPTGAMIAAPTAALPELVGGSRNWDYRYTWVRDTSFSVHALLGLGFTEEVSRYMDWLDERIREAGDHQDPLKIMYRVDGSSDLHEEVLDHLEGYRGSRPVRIGNGAADQIQLDIHGEALYAMHLADEQGIRVSHQVWKSTVRLIDWLCHNWDQRDAGIWESRHHPRNYTFGRVMSWVALDRAIRLATRTGRPGDMQLLDRTTQPDLQPGHGPRFPPGTRQLRAGVRRERARRRPPLHAGGRLRHAHRPAVAVHPRVDRAGPGLGQPGPPVRPGPLPRRAPRPRGHVQHVHVLVRRGAGPLRPAGRRPAHPGEDVHLQQPPRPLRRGDRRHR